MQISTHYLGADILRVIASKMSNKSIELLFKAGLWHIIRQFANDRSFWYDRVQSLTSAPIEYTSRDWRSVYMNLRSTINVRSGEVRMEGRRLLKSRFSSLDTIEVALELGLLRPEYNAFHLYAACIGGNISVLRMLERRWRGEYLPSEGVFVSLITDDKHDMVDLCISRCDAMASVELNNLVRVAVRENKPSILALLFDSYEVYRPVLYECLRTAIKTERKEIITVLIEHFEPTLCHVQLAAYSGGSVLPLLLKETSSIELDYALRCSIESGQLGLARTLLADLSKVEDGTEDSRIRVCYHSSAFILACSRGYLEMAQLLLDYGYVDPTTRRNQALRLATRCSYVEVVKWLLTLDCVNPLDGKKCALYVAIKQSLLARSESSILVRKLLLRDRRVWHTNLDLDTLPIDWKRMRSCLDTLILLGFDVDGEDMMDLVRRPHNTYLSLLQFLLVKEPNDDEILSWFKSCNDEQVRRAIKQSMFRQTAAFSYCPYVVLLCLLLDAKLETRDARRNEAMKMLEEKSKVMETTVMLAAYVG